MSALFFLSCDVPNPFKDSQVDQGRNWLSAFGFGIEASEDSTGWAMAYEGKSGDDFPYMELLDAASLVGAAGAQEGLSETEPVYRLSIVNLFPNGALEDDGSAWLEAVGSPHSRWSAGSIEATVDPVFDIITGTQSIHGQSLSFNRVTSAQYIGLLLSDVLLNSAGAGSGPVSSSLYQVGFLMETYDGSLNALHGFGPAPPDFGGTLSVPIPSDGDLSLSSCVFADQLADYSLYFGSDGTQEASVDDIRVTRQGLDLSLSLSLTNQALADLIPGRYEFSVWVKDDPDAGELLTEGLSPEGLMKARAMTLELRAEGSSTGGGSQVFPRPSEGWTAWTKLSLGLLDMTLDPVSLESVFSLRISPYDRSNPKALEPGAILLAAPSLTFHYRD